MSGVCSGHPDTTAGRAALWANHTRACTSCGKTHWTDRNGLFTVDPRGLVCDPCAMKPYHVERNRQARAEAGRRGQQAAAATRAARHEARRQASAETAAEREKRLKAVSGSQWVPEDDLEYLDEDDLPWDEDED